MKSIALAAALVALAAPAFAQTAPSAPAAEAAPARWSGLTVAEVTGRLTAAGLVVAPPQTNNDRIYLRVDDGPLRWVMTLFSCTNGSCPDVQFTAVFSGANATPDIVSRWNGVRRFVKAFHAAPEEEGGDPQAVAQYDVLLSAGAGPQQLDDPIQVWRSLATDLGRTVTTEQPAGAAAQ
ncbi:YbjN domain-containing protein [Brevundimonas sp.]|uniref:YbjN domain-containing protein n=1 Tax=Brevundimonas sp. TaxID=1871086 RepID=UPI002869F6B1|nr:YbjN domain-containing protein [Brevundimonas sp.]